MIRATLSILFLAITASLTACARSAASASVPTTVPSTSSPVATVTSSPIATPSDSPSPTITTPRALVASLTTVARTATPASQSPSVDTTDVGSGANRTTTTFIQTPTITASSSTGVSTPSGQQTVTLADNGKTIDLQVGQSFLLALGTGYDWSVDLADQSVVSRVVGILVVRGAQGIYKAHQPGHTTLTAVGDPPCRKAQPACGLPSRLFKVDIVVQ
jgi:hypothetical protein